MFVLDQLKPDHTVHIRHNLSIDLWLQLAKILVEYKDIFSCSSSDLGIISRRIAEHKLGIPKGTKLVFQKKRVFDKKG